MRRTPPGLPRCLSALEALSMQPGWVGAALALLTPSSAQPGNLPPSVMRDWRSSSPTRLCGEDMPLHCPPPVYASRHPHPWLQQIWGVDEVDSRGGTIPPRPLLCSPPQCKLPCPASSLQPPAWGAGSWLHDAPPCFLGCACSPRSCALGKTLPYPLPPAASHLAPRGDLLCLHCRPH